MDIEVKSNCPEETVELGRRIGKQLRGGEVFALVGALGTGKTHLIRGVAAGAGAQQDGREVGSPTFVLVKEYAARLDIYHIDAYRLDLVEQFEQIGFDDYCYPESVVLIEWGDKVESALEGLEYIRIEMVHRGPESRLIHIKNLPEHIVL